MGRTVEDIAQTHYRFLRRTMTPHAALVKMAGDYSVQADIADRSEQIYSGTLARDLRKLADRAEESADQVARRASWETRYGRFWATGRRDCQRSWVVLRMDPRWVLHFVTECDNAGCAVKHALHQFNRPGCVGVVLHRPGRYDDPVTIYPFTAADHIAQLLGDE